MSTLATFNSELKKIAVAQMEAVYAKATRRVARSLTGYILSGNPKAFVDVYFKAKERAETLEPSCIPLFTLRVVYYKTGGETSFRVKLKHHFQYGDSIKVEPNSDYKKTSNYSDVGFVYQIFCDCFWESAFDMKLTALFVEETDVKLKEGTVTVGGYHALKAATGPIKGYLPSFPCPSYALARDLGWNVKYDKVFGKANFVSGNAIDKILQAQEEKKAKTSTEDSEPDKKKAKTSTE